jgi:hypothetical protein
MLSVAADGADESMRQRLSVLDKKRDWSLIAAG